MVCLHFTMLPAYVHLAINYDARGIGVRISVLVFCQNWLSAVFPNGFHQAEVNNIKMSAE